MNKELKQFIKNLPTTPFLFVGSGLSRRYYNLPDWKSLLIHFIDVVTNNDPMGWAKYYQLCSGDYAKIADKLETDFNERWFNDSSIRMLLPELTNKVIKENCSPFKAEIASYLLNTSRINKDYEKEIADLKSLTIRNIAGFITTNYDEFLEKIAPDYKVYIGQEELIFSSIQNIAEIYKIHGSVKEPSSIVITAKDYRSFDDKAAYLSAKLLTIFLENPIIFIGYSITDENIRKIITSISNCLSNKNYQKLSNRFILIEHCDEETSTKISSHMMDISGHIIPMTKISLYNYSELYEALKEKQSTLPVKLLRMFKNEFYNYVLTNTPSKSLYVAGIDDERVSNKDLVLAIATPEQLAPKGLVGVEADDLYRDIILNTLHNSPDEILEYAYPKIIRHTNKLAVFKYLKNAKKSYPDIKEKTAVNNFDDLLNSTIKTSRNRKQITSRSIEGLTKNLDYKDLSTVNKINLDICYLNESEIIIDDLFMHLEKILKINPHILSNDTNPNIKSNLRRLIRIYDWLKYGRE